jgi:hypothetical protein
MESLSPRFSEDQREEIEHTVRKILAGPGRLPNPRTELYTVALVLRLVRTEQLWLQQVQNDLSTTMATGMKDLGWSHMGFAGVGFATLEKDGTVTFVPLES